MEFSKQKIQEVILNPRAWAEKVAETEIVKNLNRYKEAKKLGEEFAKEITNGTSSKD